MFCKFLVDLRLIWKDANAHNKTGLHWASPQSVASLHIWCPDAVHTSDHPMICKDDNPLHFGRDQWMGPCVMFLYLLSIPNACTDCSSK